MNVVFTHYSFQDANIIGIAYLAKYISTTFLYFSFENVVTIFRHPYYMDFQVIGTM